MSRYLQLDAVDNIGWSPISSMINESMEIKSGMPQDVNVSPSIIIEFTSATANTANITWDIAFPDTFMLGIGEYIISYVFAFESNNSSIRLNLFARNNYIIPNEFADIANPDSHSGSFYIQNPALSSYGIIAENVNDDLHTTGVVSNFICRAEAANYIIITKIS